MNVFVNRMFQRAAVPFGGQAVGIDEIVPRDDILAVEIYPSASNLPSEFVRIGPNAGKQGGGSASIPSPGQRPVTANFDQQKAENPGCELRRDRDLDEGVFRVARRTIDEGRSGAPTRRCCESAPGRT